MKQPMFIKNTPIDEKRISFIEKVVSRLARRSKKTASAMITPYPISSCITGEDVKGDIVKYLFPSKGVIKKALIVLDKRPATGVIVAMSISNDIGGSSKEYIITKKTSLFEPDIEVYSDDRLTISIQPVDQEKDKVSEVWIAFTWIPHVSEVEIKNQLIDSLEGELDDIPKI